MPVNEDGSIEEGSAKILPLINETGKQDAFYNPAQVFNRDFSILVLNVFSELKKHEEDERKANRDAKIKAIKEKDPDATPFEIPEYPGLTILEALAASGLRSVRYSKEIPGVNKITVNDIDETAVEHMKKNLQHNKVDTNKVTPNHGDANLVLYNSNNVFDVVDLDPYGTVSPFLDSAIKNVINGGLLCVTSTDMQILGGNTPETCFYRYGGTALKARYLHEMSLRLLYNAVASCAARHQRYVEPLISCSVDFYVRIFFRVHEGATQAKMLGSRTGLVFQCMQCECFHIQPMGDVEFKLSGRQVETGKKSIFLVKKLKKCQKTAILGQKTTKNDISDLATRKFELSRLSLRKRNRKKAQIHRRKATHPKIVQKTDQQPQTEQQIQKNSTN